MSIDQSVRNTDGRLSTSFNTQEVPRDWNLEDYIGKGFGLLGLIHLMTAVASLVSVFTVHTAETGSVTDTTGTWLLYLIGAALPWAGSFRFLWIAICQ